MNHFTKQFGKPICVIPYAALSALAARKKPLPLLILIATHTVEYFVVARNLAVEHDISRGVALANCLAFGFTWWKPIKYGE